MKRPIVLLLAAAMTLASCDKGAEPVDPSCTPEEFAEELSDALNTLSNSINPEDHRMIFRASGDLVKKVKQSFLASEEIEGLTTKAGNAVVINVCDSIARYQYRFDYSYILNTFIPNLTVKSEKIDFRWKLENVLGVDCGMSIATGGTPRTFVVGDTTIIVPTELSSSLVVDGAQQASVEAKDTYVQDKSDAVTFSVGLNGGYALNGTYNAGPTEGNVDFQLSKTGDILLEASLDVKGQKIMDLLPALMAGKEPSEVLLAVETAEVKFAVGDVSVSGPVRLSQLLTDVKSAQTKAGLAEAFNNNVSLVGKAADKEYMDIKAVADAETSVTCVLKFRDGTDKTIYLFIMENPSLVTSVSSLSLKMQQYAEMFKQYF